MLKIFKFLLMVFPLLLTMLGCSNNEQSKSYTVGIVNLSKNLEQTISAFKEGMVQYGYKEGSNVKYLYRGALNDIKQIDQEVQFMIDSDVDLIFTQTTPVTKKAKKMTKFRNIPIVFGPVFSPLSAGIVDSLTKPGKNVTGVKTEGSTGKALEWFLKAVPSAKKIYIPFHHTDKAAIHTLATLEKAAKLFNVEFITDDIKNEEELNNVLANIPSSIDAVWLTHSHLIVSNVSKIVAAANAQNKPTVSSVDQSINGVMLCYAMSQEMLGKQASRMADKILTGSSPATIPVENADYFLSINLKTAKSIDLKIPDDVLSQADIIVR